MKKLVSVKQALGYIRQSFLHATVMKVWDDKESTEVLFQWQGKRFELMSNSDAFFSEKNQFIIYEI